MELILCVRGMDNPAAAHEPSHRYIPNRGYESIDGQQDTGIHGDRNTSAAEVLNEDEDDYEDILEEDEEELEEDSLASANPNDYTKSYNRQRRLNDPSIPPSQKPKTNPQRPAANATASVDDQIHALSKHAAKIKLDDVESGLGGKNRNKDKADRATSEKVLDNRTRMILHKMIDRNIVSEVNGVLSTGKEANVYHALSEPTMVEGEEPGPPLHRAIKVYKTSILEFKDRAKYVTGDYRFKQGYNRGNNRAMVKMWAEKEMRNLRRIHAAGIPCPEPLYLKLHVLMMGFLGDKKGWPAPRLHDLDMEDQEAWKDMYVQILGDMKKMYRVCRLVHGDLSEYNLLYHEKRVFIIDVSQSVEHDHPRSLEFLRIDIKNVTDFFRRKGVDTLSERTIFGFITAAGDGIDQKDIHQTLEKYYKQRDEATAEELAALEAQDEVFRKQYIPQNLDQVYDIERDAEKISKGEGDQLVYQALLANKVVDGGVSLNDHDASEDSAESDSDEESSGGFEDDVNKRPRGKRFEDKDAKKVSN